MVCFIIISFLPAVPINEEGKILLSKEMLIINDTDDTCNDGKWLWIYTLNMKMS